MSAGAVPPAPWRDAPVVTIDDAVLADPGPTVRRLHEAWARREPVVIALGIDPAAFREPQAFPVEPWRVAPEAEPWFDRLHFLTWANTYDARAGEATWWWGVKAARLDDGATATPDGAADITLADGSPAWIDGGPRMPAPPGMTLVHSDSVDLGALTVVPHEIAPQADLAPDQLAAVAHTGGPARVIAPAGSGKTRVLTERLRHLHLDRGLRTGGRPRRRLQQAGPAGDGGPHHRLPAPGPHAQLARPVDAGRAPWRVTPGGRRARGAAADRLAAPRHAASAAPTPTRSVRTSRG